MRLYAQVSGAIFSFIAVAQLVRAVMRLPVQVADVFVPIWASACAFVGMSVLAIWAFRTARSVA
jgi:hypothetical protein